MASPETEQKVTWKSWLWLIFLIVSLSGIFEKADGGWGALDFMRLTGNFGEVAKGVNFTGKGGTGARDGFLFAITLIPTVMFALGLVQAAESMGALKAAEILFRPILRPLLGIPGVTGLAFVSSFTSSDVGAVMTKTMAEEGRITDDERTIFVAYQYPGSAVVANTFGTGGPLLPITVLPVGVIILVVFTVKILGANMVRFYLKWDAARNKPEGSKTHG